MLTDSTVSADVISLKLRSLFNSLLCLAFNQTCLRTSCFVQWWSFCIVLIYIGQSCSKELIKLKVLTLDVLTSYHLLGGKGVFTSGRHFGDKYLPLTEKDFGGNPGVEAVKIVDIILCGNAFHVLSWDSLSESGYGVMHEILCKNTDCTDRYQLMNVLLWCLLT